MVVATGIYKHPYVLRVMLAECATFRSIVDETTNAAAQGHIALHDTDDRNDEEFTSELPRAIIVRSEHHSEAAGTSMAYAVNVSLMIHFEFKIPFEENLETREEEEIWFMNQIGAIMSELEALSNAMAAIEGSAPLTLREHKISNGPDRLTDEERPLEPGDEINAPKVRESAWFVSIEITL